MKTLFLIAPSEGKNKHSEHISKKSDQNKETLSFKFEKPLDIAFGANEKDLKCSGDRYIEGIKLNKNIINPTETMSAIYRYSGVMYNAIDYADMSETWKRFFEENFLILSGMYGLLKPLDEIWNYKLPIETKWLYQFWWDKIVKKIIELKPDMIVNLLPMSYAKMIWIWQKNPSKLEQNGIKVVNVNFLKNDGNKISHGVKWLRWSWIKNICENEIVDYKDFDWEVLENIKGDNLVDINIFV